MEKTYKVFTVKHDSVVDGAGVDALPIKSAGIEIPAIVVGENGRNRKRGVLPVGDCATPAPTKPIRLMAASIGQTRTGKSKLFWADRASSSESVLVVLRSQIGYRGGNEHTGDRSGWLCRNCKVTGSGPALPDACPGCEADGAYYGPYLTFKPRPGQILASGQIAQGGAGRMGSGEQLVVLLPAGEVLRVGRSGRLYGAPSAHYIRWDGEKLISLTWDEREASDLF